MTAATTPNLSGPLPLPYILTPQTRQFNAGIAGGWGGQSLAYAMSNLPSSVQEQLEEHPDWFEQ